METVKHLESSRQELPGVGGVNIQKVMAGTGRPSPARRLRVLAGAWRSITGGEPGSGRPAGSASEAVVVPIEPGGQHNRR